MFGIKDEVRAIVIAGSGGLGFSFVESLHLSKQCTKLWATSRNPEAFRNDGTVKWWSMDITKEDTIRKFVKELKQVDFNPNLVLNCSGLLHNDIGVQPEKTWRHLEMEKMSDVFSVNAFGMALLAKHIIPCMPRHGRSIFASISARVGSISDNYLGGWYSYRASKAAHNMLMKTISIEAKRKHKELICVSLHPGTIKTKLSAPFTSRTDPQKLFTPNQSRDYLIDVVTGLTPEDSGNFFAWDGQAIEF